MTSQRKCEPRAGALCAVARWRTVVQTRHRQHADCGDTLQAESMMLFRDTLG